MGTHGPARTTTQHQQREQHEGGWPCQYAWWSHDECVVVGLIAAVELVVSSDIVPVPRQPEMDEWYWWRQTTEPTRVLLVQS